ncbi:hypothetical protein GCM10027286_15600 [Virgibacillus ainsalahensis]
MDIFSLKKKAILSCLKNARLQREKEQSEDPAAVVFREEAEAFPVESEYF